MHCIINGERREFGQPVTVAGLVEQLSLLGKRIAVEHNGEVVPKSRHSAAWLSDGDRIEIIVAVGGG